MMNSAMEMFTWRIETADERYKFEALNKFSTISTPSMLSQDTQPNTYRKHEDPNLFKEAIQRCTTRGSSN